MTNSRKIFMTGKPISDGSGGKLSHWMALLISQLCFGIAIAWLYLCMRGIMRLGGFVASGGPYHIAHQAPGWVWMMPVSIFLGLIAVFASFAATKRIGGPNLMALAWSGLFISLGWNFLEFGLYPPMGEGPVWGWIIPGVLFIPMGAIPLLIIFSSVRASLRTRRENQGLYETDGENRQKRVKWGPSLLLQLIAVGLGIYLGIGFFNTQTNPQRSDSKTVKKETSRKSLPKKSQYHGTSVEFQNKGRILTLMALPDGSWDIVFEGEVYERISELPKDIQRLFRKSLENVKGVRK